MKPVATFVLFSLIVGITFAQERTSFSAWGTIGLGFADMHYSKTSGSACAQLGLGIQYNSWRLKFDRRVNNEISIFSPPEKVDANSILLGHSIQPFNRITTLSFNFNIGLGYVHTITRGKIIHYEPFNNEYEFLTERSLGYSLEGSLEYRSKYFGISINIFSNFNNLRDFYGLGAGFLFGYL